MTILVVNHEIIKSIRIRTAVSCQMIKFHLDIPEHSFRQVVKCMMAIRWQHLTLSALDSGRVHHLPHALLHEKDTYCLPEGNQ